jgi:putative hemolysin
VIPAQLFLLLALAGLSIFLASAEASFHLLKRRRLTRVAFADEARIELAERYLDDPPRLLMPAHLGTYTAHVGMTVIMTSLFFDLLTHWAMLAAFAAMMLYLLLFRASLPYALVARDPEGAFLRLLPAFHLYASALHPIIAPLRRRGAPDPEEEEPGAGIPEVPPPPVEQVDEQRLEDALDRFSETLVREVMTPRPDVVAIEAAAPVRDLHRLMSESKYSRIPVYGKDLDDIQGVVEVRDLLDFQGEGDAQVGGLSRPVHFVPETKRIASLLKEMQSLRVTFAVAIDEYGGTAGIVTVEDIVEELVGEIQDEYDAEGEPLAVEPDGAILVDGRVSVDRLEEALETELSIDAEIDTVGGLVTSVFGQIPRAGQKKRYRGFEIEVLVAARNRVNRVRFRRSAVRNPA